MARGDYKGCDVCDGKAFYDANLNYEQPSHGLHDLEGRDISTALDYCAQHGAICTDCYAKGWRLKVVRADPLNVG